MLTREELVRLTAGERARYERAGPLDKPFLEEEFRKAIARRPSEPVKRETVQMGQPLKVREPAKDPLFDGPPRAKDPVFDKPLGPPPAAPWPTVIQPSETQYRAARVVLAMEDFIAKALLAISALWFVWSAYSVINAFLQISRYGGTVDFGTMLGFLSLGSLLPSLGLALVALFMFAHGQMLRATLDTADSTRELLMVTKAAVGRGRGNGHG